MEEAEQVGLRLNVEKTKFMAIPALQHDMTLQDGTVIKQTEEFKYLGSLMSSAAVDMNTRRGQAWGAFWDMKKIWHSKEISTDLKVRIFQTTCLSILLYGCEAWVLTKVMCKRLDSFATSCYRYMLHIKRTDHVKNETILKTVNQQPLSDTVRERQLRRLGHVLRMKEDNISRMYAMYGPNHGRGNEAARDSSTTNT